MIVFVEDAGAFSVEGVANAEDLRGKCMFGIRSYEVRTDEDV